MKKLSTGSLAAVAAAPQNESVVGALVAGLKHARLAERLDPLVVAVGAAPAVADLAERAARATSVIIAASMSPACSIARLDQIGADRVHRRDVAHQVARHVEVVDRHVAEQAARDLDVGDRRRAGVARGDDHLLELADLTRPDALAQRLERGIEAAVEADHDGRRRAP